MGICKGVSRDRVGIVKISWKIKLDFIERVWYTCGIIKRIGVK